MDHLENAPVFLAFLLTLFAGMATGLGGLFALLSKKFEPRFLALTLGFSAGVMIYVAMIEMFAQAKSSLQLAYGNFHGHAMTAAAFMGGILITALIDKLVPSSVNPHEVGNIEVIDPKCGETIEDTRRCRLKRVGIFAGLAIAIHNFPEGMATFFATLQDPSLGMGIAIAVAIHNIPEGVAVAVPIYFATKSKGRAFLLSLGSGLAEPLGAIIGWLVLRPFMGDATFGVIFAMVAGIMVYISLDELLPTAEEYGEHHIAIGGVIIGFLVMGTSLVLMEPMG